MKTQLIAQAPERNHREVRLGVTIISETRSQRKPIKIVDFEIIWVCIITIILFMPSWPYGSSSLPWAIAVLICTVTNTHEPQGMRYFFLNWNFYVGLEKWIMMVRFFLLRFWRVLVLVLTLMHPFLMTKLTEASKSQKIDSKFSTKTKSKTFQNLKMPPPLESFWCSWSEHLSI